MGNETLSMYNSVNLRVLSTIPTQLSSPLKCKCGIKICNDRFYYKRKALLIEGYAVRLKTMKSAFLNYNIVFIQY